VRVLESSLSPLLILIPLFPLLHLNLYGVFQYSMAIHPRLRPDGGHLSPQQARAISAWTEQHAATSLQGMTLSDADTPTSPTPTRSALATVSLSIPLDDEPAPTKVEPRPTVSFRRRAPLQAGSSKSREGLLKGKDGSRRRQRWENGKLTR
jgi:hypothetical protein